MKPLVTAALVLANVAVFAIELAWGVEPTCETYGVTPDHVIAGTVLSGMFLHAGWSHLGWNMVLLAPFGTAVESKLGHLRFAVLYFLSGIGAALMHVFVNPSANDALVGCSGCVFGILAASAILFPRLLGFVCTYVAIEIGCLLLGTDGTVSSSCHIGGFSTGFATMLLFRRIVVD
jgi:membrane associated rhomboid family serine protease